MDHSYAPLTLITLGGAELVSPQGPVLGPGKPLALLIFLASSPGHTASREFLIDLLWADMETERARHALRQTLWHIRQTVGEAVLKGREEISLGMPLPSDRDEFLEAASRGDGDRAVAIYRGPFLPAFAAPGGAEFEHWADHERDRLRDTFLRTAELTVRRKLGASQFREAQRLARRARDESPANELGWRLLIESLLAGRDQISARVEADALELRLQADGRIPEPATRALLATAHRSDSGDPEAQGRTDLVAELIGREREFAALVGAWEAARQGTPQHVHLEATAGLGKTRLLLDLQARLQAAGAPARYLRAQPADRTIPFATAGDLARMVAELPGAIGVSPASAATLVSLNPTLSSRFSAPPDTSTGDEALRRRTLALGEAIVAAAEEAPFALLVDDLHWCDRHSRDLLLGLLSRLREGRILLVTACRPAPDLHPVTDITVTLPLNPLSLAQTGDLAASLGAIPESEGWTREFIPALHRCSSGSPLSILETLKLALDEGCLLLGTEGWSCPDPGGIQRILNRGTALQARIASLPSDARQLLALLAAAGSALGLDRLAEASGLPRGRLEPVLLDLERRGLATRAGDLVGVAHDEIATAAAKLFELERDRLDLALGRALASVAADHVTAARAARHLMNAGNTHEVAALFRRLAHAARRQGDRRPFRTLAAELLGSSTVAPEVGALVSLLPVRLRLGLWSGQRLAAAAILLTAAVTMTGYAAVAGRSPEPPMEMVLWRPLDAGGSEAVATAMDPGAWQVDADVTAGGRRTIERDPLLASSDGRILYVDASTMVFASAEDNKYTDDLFVRSGGISRYLVHSLSDDIAPALSPDGKQVAFATLRWSPPDSGSYDLAIQPLTDGPIHRLTTTSDSEQWPQWSPDGTRIAFGRKFAALRPAELCWTTPDGARERCRILSDKEPSSILGWRGPSHVLLTTLGDSGGAVFQVGLDDGSEMLIRRLPPGGSAVSASPDGELIACRCGPMTGNRHQWIVFPVGDPSRARTFSPEADSLTMSVLWRSNSAHRRRLDRLILAGQDSMVPLDSPFKLEVSGADSSGRVIPVVPLVLRWSSSDSAIAHVDSLSGEILAHHPGRFAVRVSAGGWRAASVNLVATAPREPLVLLDERWREIDTARWKPFGIPSPRIAVADDGTAGLNNNGDGSYQSGVYSSFTLTPERGLGFEALLSLPVNRSRWQTQGFWLGPASALKPEGWDHRSTFMPVVTAEFQQSCSFGYPTGEGPYALRRLNVAAAGQPQSVVVEPDSLLRGWHRLRVQLFPDGTCGFALDGTLLWRSTLTIPTNREFRIMMRGNSAGTTILVGPLTIWQGVRTDIDWSKAPR